VKPPKVQNFEVVQHQTPGYIIFFLFGGGLTGKAFVLVVEKLIWKFLWRFM